MIEVIRPIYIEPAQNIIKIPAEDRVVGSGNEIAGSEHISMGLPEIHTNKITWRK